MDPIDRVESCLAKLPGVGRRSAERMAAKLARDRALLDELVSSLGETRDRVRECSRCGSITTVDREPCRLCTDSTREDGVLCVVEDPNDIDLIERSGAFRGRYHALMGTISPMKGSGPDDLRLKSLLKRIAGEKFDEVILALNTDVESEATAGYIAEVLREKGVKVTRLAYGLPAGSGIRYSDPVTLDRAIRGRQKA